MAVRLLPELKGNNQAKLKTQLSGSFPSSGTGKSFKIEQCNSFASIISLSLPSYRLKSRVIVLPFETMDEILTRDHSNESC